MSRKEGETEGFWNSKILPQAKTGRLTRVEQVGWEKGLIGAAH